MHAAADSTGSGSAAWLRGEISDATRESRWNRAVIRKSEKSSWSFTSGEGAFPVPVFRWSGLEAIWARPQHRAQGRLARHSVRIHAMPLCAASGLRRFRRRKQHATAESRRLKRNGSRLRPDPAHPAEAAWTTARFLPSPRPALRGDAAGGWPSAGAPPGDPKAVRALPPSGHG